MHTNGPYFFINMADAFFNMSISSSFCSRSFSNFLFLSISCCSCLFKAMISFKASLALYFLSMIPLNSFYHFLIVAVATPYSFSNDFFVLPSSSNSKINILNSSVYLLLLLFIIKFLSLTIF